MFALEITFHDGVSSPELLLVRRPHAIIGSGDSAHVVIEGTSSSLYGLRLVRGLGREFRCQPLSKGDESKMALPFQEAAYAGDAEVNLGEVTTHITSLDIDMQLTPLESPDRAGVRILRRALSMPSPLFPAVAVIGGTPLFLSFLSDEPVLVGRSRKCGLRLDASDVSSEHARIGFDNGKFWVEDLGSTNGTFVAGDRVVGRRQIHDGEIITVGAEFNIVGIKTSDDLAYLEQKNAERQTPKPGGPFVAQQEYPCLISVSELIRPSRLVIPRTGKVKIGRDPACDLWVSASHASRNHAELEIDAGGTVYVADTSSNGTYLGSERLPRGTPVAITKGPAMLDIGGGIRLGICLNAADETLFAEQSQGVGRPSAEDVLALGQEAILRAQLEESSPSPLATDSHPAVEDELLATKAHRKRGSGVGGGVFERLAQRAGNRATAIREGEDELQSLPGEDHLSQELGVTKAPSGPSGDEESAYAYDTYPPAMSGFGKVILWFVVVLLVLVVLGLFVWVVGGDALL